MHGYNAGWPTVVFSSSCTCTHDVYRFKVAARASILRKKLYVQAYCAAHANILCADCARSEHAVSAVQTSKEGMR